MFKDSNEVIQHIEEITKHRVYELNNFKDYMNSIDNPQYKLKCIHIGGTNGKGSTTNYIRSILQSAGYKVGTFTSPYLETHMDRIRINDEFISDATLVRYANENYEQWIKANLSMFEIDMSIAVHYFIDNKVDIAIFEVGLGGSVDATNIINPWVSVITNIGLDHTDYLGDTYELIAKAKAGIIKYDRALICGETKPECLEIFKEETHKKRSHLEMIKEIKNIRIDNKIVFDYDDMQDIELSTLAKYQTHNAALAIETIRYLNAKGLIRINNNDIYNGLKNTFWKGRFEVVNTNPLIIIDGAHNNQGIKALVDSCSIFDNVSIIFTALKDKTYTQMLEMLCSISDDVTISEFDFIRAAKAEDIAKGFNVKIEKDYKKAISLALMKDNVTIITGSLYFISLVREYFVSNKMKGESTHIE